MKVASFRLRARARPFSLAALPREDWFRSRQDPVARFELLGACIAYR